MLVTPPKHQCKIIVLGESGAGKSSIITRYVSNKFEQKHCPTMGAVFSSKEVVIGQRPVKYNIWDTAGQERYRALSKMYYRDSIVAILVYDLTQEEKHRSLLTWIEELKNEAPKSLILAVAANKEDLCNDKDSEAESWARRIGAVYQRTSAKTGLGVEELFAQIAQRLNNNYAGVISNTERRRSTIQIKPPTIEVKSSCCAGKTHTIKAQTA